MSIAPVKPLPTQKLLREWFYYEPESGVFTWIKEPKKIGSMLGKTAGTNSNGYRCIRVPGHRQLGAHRLAWIYMHGDTISALSIDHVDGNPSNNAISNLRLATSTQQNQNKRVRSDNRSGLKGAFYVSSSKTWTSQISVEGNSISLGYFSTAEAAHAAYSAAAAKYFGNFARTT